MKAALRGQGSVQDGTSASKVRRPRKIRKVIETVDLQREVARELAGTYSNVGSILGSGDNRPNSNSFIFTGTFSEGAARLDASNLANYLVPHSRDVLKILIAFYLQGCTPYLFRVKASAGGGKGSSYYCSRCTKNCGAGFPQALGHVLTHVWLHDWDGAGQGSKLG